MRKLVWRAGKGKYSGQKVGVEGETQNLAPCSWRVCVCVCAFAGHKGSGREEGVLRVTWAIVDLGNFRFLPSSCHPDSLHSWKITSSKVTLLSHQKQHSDPELDLLVLR